MANRPGSNIGSGFITFLAIVIVVAVLYVAKAVLLPIAVAVLLSFILAPLVIRLQRLGLGRVFSVVIVTILSFSAIGVLGWIVTGQIIDLAGQLPQYRQNIRAKVEAVKVPSGSLLGKATEGIKEIIKEVTPAQPDRAGAIVPATGTDSAPSATQPTPVKVVESPPNAFTIVAAAVKPLLGPLARAAIVIVFVFFMLIQREDLRDRVIRLMGQGRLTLTTKAIDDAATRVSRYLLALLMINTTYGVAAGVGLYFIGLPNAFLWGVLAGLIRFIPYVGPWIGAALPITLSLAVSEGWSTPLMTVGLFIVIELLSNNVMEPLVYGSQTGLTPIAILLSAVFWAWLWGPVGLVLATPLTVCLVVIGRYVPKLEFLDLMLGDRPALPLEARVYQRLLAMDQDEVFQLADEYLKEHTLLEFYDHVLLPALAMAERDRQRGELEPRREQFIYHGLRDLIENLGERQRSAAEKSATSAEAASPGAPPQERVTGFVSSIMCIPARDEGDEVAGLMLAQLAQFEGLAAEVVSVQTLSGEFVELVEQHQPDFVVISALPPSAIMHSRYVCKRLKACNGDPKAIVGLWTVADLDKARERIRTCGTDRVVSSLTQALGQLRS
ncbi:MAG: AI-2E family transporter [Phycisphaerales bacterium]|nr:AI-2E family transporter [Phycisphaerales bacterium]MCI0629128.1 AI-2E family transporter [Phycisphaerales bacterium]MCI0676669.1 AI-2E family transporter [Phycisphaerales bacterium]